MSSLDLLQFRILGLGSVQVSEETVYPHEVLAGPLRRQLFSLHVMAKCSLFIPFGVSGSRVSGFRVQGCRVWGLWGLGDVMQTPVNMSNIIPS